MPHCKKSAYTLKIFKGVLKAKSVEATAYLSSTVSTPLFIISTVHVCMHVIFNGNIL